MSDNLCPKCGATLMGLNGRTCPDCPGAEVRKIFTVTCITFMVTMAVFPIGESSLLLAFLSFITLWPLMGTSLWRRFTAATEGGLEKLFFGLMAVALAGAGALVLIFGVCAAREAATRFTR